MTPRFYYPEKLAPQQQFKLPAKTTHYAMRVLRLGDGAAICLFDGTGGQYPATLEIHGKDFYANTATLEPIENELNGEINLFQGIASGDKMDWIVEKAVELGISNFYPINTQRSVVKLAGDRLKKRIQHWQNIAIAASEQCGRNRIMQVHQPKNLAASMVNNDATKLFFDPDGTHDLKLALADCTNQLEIFIGPEGGWSTEEYDVAKKHQLQFIVFGKRILRTETAGIVMTAAVSALLGW